MDATRLSRTEAALLVAAFVLLTGAKFLVAGQLDPFWDEAYYWQAANHPALGYADKPFMTALLVKLGVTLAGDGKFGLRFAFLAIGAAFPLAVYWAARPLVEKGDAWRAAGLSMLLPTTAWHGILAFQDTPMMLFALIGFGAFARARRDDRAVWWLLVGAACAAGFATHYRFVFFPVALALYLLASARGRTLLRRPGPWLAGGLAVVGLIPILVYNLQTDFVSLGYQVMERNPWRFQPKGLRQPLEQALAVSPLMYLALLAILFDCLRRARRDDDAALVGLVAGFQLGIYLVLGPFADLKHFDVHWPAPGYLPLLLIAPRALRGFASGGAGAARRWRRGFALTAPALGALMVAGGMSYVVASAWPERLLPDALLARIDHNLFAWSGLADAARDRLAAFEDPSAVVVVGGNYRIASALDFALKPQRPVYTLDHPRNARDGLGFQYRQWGLDQTALGARAAGSPALIAVEDEDHWYLSAKHVAWLTGICSLFDEVRPLGVYEFPSGKAAIRLYAGVVRAAPAAPPTAFGPGNCAVLLPVLMLRPTRGQRVGGAVTVYGWALDPAGVASVEILLDGESVARASYGITVTPDPRERMPGARDPNLPAIGFDARWDTTGAAPGRHRLSLRVTTRDGRVWEHGDRNVVVERGGDR